MDITQPPPTAAHPAEALEARGLRVTTRGRGRDRVRVAFLTVGAGRVGGSSPRSA